MSDLRTYAARLPRPRKGAFGTVIKLALASVIVGLIMGALGLNPIELWTGLWHAATDGVREALDWGTGWVAVLFAAMATGAAVVLPLWLLRRLLRGR